MCADLGHKPVTDFSNLMAELDTSQKNHQGTIHSLQEGMQDDKSEEPNYPHPLPIPEMKTLHSVLPRLYSTVRATIERTIHVIFHLTVHMISEVFIME